MNGYSWTQYFSDYWNLLRGRRTSFILLTILRSASDLAPFAIAYFIGAIVDFFVGYSADQPLNLFFFYVSMIVFLGVSQVWLRFFAKIRMQDISARIRKEARVLAINKLIDLDLKWHDSNETGSKIQRINEGGESIYKGLKDFSNKGITILVSVLGSLVLFLALDLRYLAFSIIYLLIYFMAENYFNKRLSYWQDELNKTKEWVSGKVHDSASNILAIKSLGLKETINKHSEGYEEEYYAAWVKNRNASQLKMKTLYIYSAIVYGLFILILGLDAMIGAITVGSIFVYASYFGRLKGSATDFTNNIGEFISAKSGVGRFITILGVKALKDESRLKKFPSDWKEIEFKNVYFKYKNEDVLQDFSLKIKRNEKIGIAGKSGSGKSTITKLILKLYTPAKGSILVDGKNLNSFSQHTITKHVGIALQEPEMFNMTLLENITITAKKPNPETLEKAIKVSQLKPVISKLPEGLNSLIGEKGYRLSGGERQRIGLARTINKNPDLLVLDEATSALDNKTEELIQKAIKEELKDKTSITIAHRTTTLKNTDKIIVIEKGRITKTGKYTDLKKKKII